MVHCMFMHMVCGHAYGVCGEGAVYVCMGSQ